MLNQQEQRHLLYNFSIFLFKDYMTLAVCTESDVDEDSLIEMLWCTVMRIIIVQMFITFVSSIFKVYIFKIVQNVLEFWYFCQKSKLLKSQKDYKTLLL